MGSNAGHPQKLHFIWSNAGYPQKLLSIGSNAGYQGLDLSLSNVEDNKNILLVQMWLSAALPSGLYLSV